MARPFCQAVIALAFLSCAPAVCGQTQVVVVPASAPEPGVSPPGQPPVKPVPSFSSLFRQVATDLQHLPARENLAWLGVGAGASLLGHGADRKVTATLSTSGPVEDVLDPGQVIGGVLFQMGGAFTTYAVGRLTGTPAVADVGADLIRSQILSQAVTQGVKVVATRTRPDGTRFSFPSGHSAAAFASAAVLQRHFGWKVGGPAYGVAAYVAASRLSENRHYLSDVIFGAAIGTMAARTVTIGHGRAKFALVPLATTRGAGIALAKVSLP